MAITAVGQGYEWTSIRYDYRTGSGITYGGMGIKGDRVDWIETRSEGMCEHNSVCLLLAYQSRAVLGRISKYKLVLLR